MARVTKRSACPKCRERGKDRSGDNLIHYEDGGAHCFSCGFHNDPKFFHSFTPKVVYGSKSLPTDFTREVPAEGWKWLLQWGLPYTHWKPYTGYTPEEHRLVLLGGDPHNPSFSIGRRLVSKTDGDEQKHRGDSSRGDQTNRASRKWVTWGESHSYAIPQGRSLGGATVVVEDLISAHKVGTITETLPLMGTALYPAHIKFLQQRTDPIIMWLDNDQKGLVSKKALKLNMLTGRTVYIVHTVKDPKAISFDEIRYTINSVIK